MIDELRVQDLALIHDASMEPARGLTVVTGETGSGKTALLSAIKLLMGERADASSVREGALGLTVEGRIFLSDEDRDGVVVRRSVAGDGRGRVHVNGHLSSVRELAEGPGASIDLCGQHEHQRLLQQQAHVELLDAWASAAILELREAYARSLDAARKASRALERVREMSRLADEKVDEAAFVLNRIDEVSPREGEYEELEEVLPVAEHAEHLLRVASSSREALSGDEGVCDLLSRLVRELQDAGGYDPKLGGYAASLEGALIDIEDVAGELRRYQDGVELDEEGLARMQQRMSQLQGLLRSYGPRMQEVFERREAARELVSAARDGGKRVRAAEEELRKAEESLLAAADALDEARRRQAPLLARAIGEQMSFLEMGSASVEFSFERLERSQWGASGPSRIELMYRPAAGLSARPLRRIASGGEVSRVMLACKVVLGQADGTQTLVFDEVDAGVGGSAAVALAQLLRRLSQTHQVIVVTHLAQVAVVGERHYLVRKSPGSTPETKIVPIEADQRVREISRMLSGDASEASQLHARQMLRDARAEAQETLF
ncbi:DNA repair protein RecN [Olsenella urininfantis]|uniref:DNA repair protein RecN n=1 Tax=Olsenella urininfantis TaxID=1871033 RepID=UPI000986752E|nr:AAA family ATPase [Olsenella urininfantis]